MCLTPFYNHCLPSTDPQKWLVAPDQVPALSRAVSQLHLLGAKDNFAQIVLRCALAFAIWENFLRPILSELFPFNENKSTKTTALNPLVVIPMLNSCQQVVQAMSAYAKQVSQTNAATVASLERLSLSEFGHDPLCAACLRLLPGGAEALQHSDRPKPTDRLVDSALEALKVICVFGYY